ncbi:MAG: LamG-like jellyroll fold domain-containing protein [Chthoniobacteraceae bacterium]
MIHRILLPLLASAAIAAAQDFRAGAAAVDITPTTFPIVVNGGFTEKTAAKAFDSLFARALVLDDGRTRIALCVVDTCMMGRGLIDGAKAIASRETGIPTERMLVSATHTHTAPSCMGALGSTSDENYALYLQVRVADAIAEAARNLAPARIGWTVVPAWEFTNCRRWIRRPDKMIADPFGLASGRAHMHPGYESPDAIGPSGPTDPDLSLLSVQTRDGKPLALLANFSMHYFGAQAVSADYFGKFAAGIGKLIGAGDSFVGIMSQGTSGDSHWMDYSKPKTDMTLDRYADGVMRLAADAYAKIEHRDSAPLAMAEATLPLKMRVADESRLEWARKLVREAVGRGPKTKEEVYAREQLIIAAEPEREIVLQAVRIGDIGITALPNEVYAITGLKLKARSPLRTTFNIELANGGDGYIPPPEQHALGGYTTWAARTAGLEPQAEPRIVETLLGLLEKVSGEKRRAIAEPVGAYGKAVLADKPAAFWRLNEIEGRRAADASGRGADAAFEDGVALHLPGVQRVGGAISTPPEVPSPFSGGQINRAAHFAGGRLRADAKLGPAYSVELWLWNGLAANARAITGYVFSLGADGDKTAAGDHLGIGGTANGEAAGRLIFFNGNKANTTLTGRTELAFRDWHHVVLVRDGRKVRAYLDGKLEFEGDAEPTSAAGASAFLGGRCDGFANFEGKLDEVAIYDRAISDAEVARHFQVAGRTPPAR